MFAAEGVVITEVVVVITGVVVGITEVVVVITEVVVIITRAFFVERCRWVIVVKGSVAVVGGVVVFTGSRWKRDPTVVHLE